MASNRSIARTVSPTAQTRRVDLSKISTQRVATTTTAAAIPTFFIVFLMLNLLVFGCIAAGIVCLPSASDSEIAL